MFPKVTWAVLLLFHGPKLFAHVGSASSPFSSPYFPFFQPERNEDGNFLFGETQPFLSNSQHELHFRASLIVFSPVHHQNGPNKKPHFSLFHCERYLPCPFDLLPSSFISFWPYVCSDLESDGSSISLDRERMIPRRLLEPRNMDFAGAGPARSG